MSTAFTNSKALTDKTLNFCKLVFKTICFVDFVSRKREKTKPFSIILFIGNQKWFDIGPYCMPNAADANATAESNKVRKLFLYDFLLWCSIVTAVVTPSITSP